ncbi:excalibur calcium-binding domain-containing protein [Xanthomonas translucens pv. graminis]|uniref:excalibur calcium-binding domain-containing protein n=1 Tax=Xanthomonas graminis TaxID=3390026 RepID=UPI002540D1F6|nr:excalibur calcium-binding domain-containing protein [Xanthomonas translucens]WIH05164.1 excalibur calcium-binding domain-containing protein [Xanthomonas translucens pv. graminis]
MRTHGTLIKWDDERGIGFVRSAHGDGEIVVHIAASPCDGARPRLGELISFDLEQDAEGRPRAVRVMRPGRAPTTPARRAAADAPSGSAFGRVLAVLLVIGIGACAYLLIAPRFAATPTPSVAVPRTSSAATAPTSIAPATPTATAQAIPAAAAPAQHFQCDGRTHCAQMTSCEEATYFLRNCPGVQMDGNHDGVPCERQWCH